MDDVWGTEEDLYYVDPDDIIYSQVAVMYGLSPETLNEKELILVKDKLSIEKIESSIINEELSIMKNKIPEKECVVLKVKEIYGRDVYSPVNLMNLGLFSLRLLRNDSFLFGPIITYGEDQNSYSYTNYDSIHFRSKNITLNKKEKKKLIQIVNGVYNLHPETDTHYRVSFSRFSRYFSNRQVEDKLIDLCIAFEALFLNGIYKRNICAYLCNACSNLIAENKKDEQAIRKNIQTFYDLRNNVMHGGDVKEYKIWEVLPQCANYYRQSILTII